MEDIFKDHMVGLESPAMAIDMITPDDGNDLANVSRAINVAESGFVQVTTALGHVGRVYVAAGGLFAIRAKRIWQTGTTAVGVVALY